MITKPGHLDQLILGYASTDIPVFDEDCTVGTVLETIRRTGLGNRIAYFYAVGKNKELVGVIPTRRLLTAELDCRLKEIMIRRIVALPRNATVYDACELFITHKFLALPIVDEERRIVGIVDVSVLTDQVFDVAEKREAEDVFTWIGVRLSQVRTASPLKAYRYRSPWLTATLAGGLGCAAIAGLFESTLEQSLALALFFAVALGLGESVAIQSMTLTIQNLHARSGTEESLWKSGVRELTTAFLLGVTFGAAVALVAFVWRWEAAVSVAIGVSIALAVSVASLIGMGVPAVLHKLRRDPQVAAGPVALALADACTSLLYFGTAAFALK